MKRRCYKCENIATWKYAPGQFDLDDDYYCDEHVPRGCSCQNIDYAIEAEDLNMEDACGLIEDMKSIEVDDEFYILDDKRRRLPCCEYWNDEEGFDL